MHQWMPILEGDYSKCLDFNCNQYDQHLDAVMHKIDSFPDDHLDSGYTCLSEDLFIPTGIYLSTAPDSRGDSEEDTPDITLRRRLARAAKVPTGYSGMIGKGNFKSADNAFLGIVDPYDSHTFSLSSASSFHVRHLLARRCYS